MGREGKKACFYVQEHVSEVFLEREGPKTFAAKLTFLCVFVDGNCRITYMCLFLDRKYMLEIFKN